MNDFDTYRDRIERVLDAALTQSEASPHLIEAMRYSTLSGGKRVRALLCYSAGSVLNASLEKCDAVAAALECIHSYSLIHDDLPAMDNDDLRRGKATNHIQFDQATAILAGDALLTLAFELINQPNSQLSDAQARKISTQLAVCAGQTGMVGGQMLDILSTDKNTNKIDSIQQLENIHRRKTGALIKAAVLCGAYCSDAPSEQQIKALEQYADNLGLAFQVVDDILDIESSTEILGKTSGADINLGKSTYPALIGIQQSKQLAEKLYHQAMESIQAIGDNSQLLIKLAELIIQRQQ